MALIVVRPGLWTTVQDLGRFGFRDRGEPVSGPFDRRSASLANALLGNEEDAAVLEMTMLGGVFEAETTLALSFTGAAMKAWIEREEATIRELSIPQTFTIEKGERLHLGGAADAVRTYMSVSGGWKTPIRAGSRSSERPLQAGDRLDAEPGWTDVRRPAFSTRPDLGPIRFIAGPDFETDLGKRLMTTGFQVSNTSSRMGIRLIGGEIAFRGDPDRLSAPVAPGAIQATPDGLIVLGPACGTMGGYPHIGHVLRRDLDRLGQMRPGSVVRFELVDLETARALDRETRLMQDRIALILRTRASERSPR